MTPRPLLDVALVLIGVLVLAVFAILRAKRQAPRVYRLNSEHQRTREAWKGEPRRFRYTHAGDPARHRLSPKPKARPSTVPFRKRA